MAIGVWVVSGPMEAVGPPPLESIPLYGTLPHKWANDPVGIWQVTTLQALAYKEVQEQLWEELQPMAVWLPTEEEWSGAARGYVGLCHVEMAISVVEARLMVVAWAGMSDHHADARLWVRDAPLGEETPWGAKSVEARALGAWGAGMSGTMKDYG